MNPWTNYHKKMRAPWISTLGLPEQHPSGRGLMLPIAPSTNNMGTPNMARIALPVGRDRGQLPFK